MKALDYFLQRQRFKLADKYIVYSDKKLLDIGCDNCGIFKYLNSKRIYGYGIDSKKMEAIHIQSMPNHVKFIHSTYPCEELKDEKFDYITALAVLEHIPETEQINFSKACFEHLDKKGRLIITVPSPIVDKIIDFLKFIKILDGMEDNQHYGFKTQETIPLFKKAGFKLYKHKRFQLGLNHLFVFEK